MAISILKLCEIHAVYEGVRSNSRSNISNKSKSIDLDLNPIFDFANTEPDRYRINIGAGFLIRYIDSIYVTTCSNTVIGSTRYVAILDFDHTIKTVRIEVHRRIPEIDTVVMRLAEPLDLDLDLDLNTILDPKYQNNIIIPKVIDKSMTLETLNIIKISTVYTSLVSSQIQYIPNLSIELDIDADLKGISGSIVVSDKPIGMVIIKKTTIRAVEFDLMFGIIINSLNNRLFEGIQLSYIACEAELNGIDINVGVINSISTYPNGINGKKDLFFKEQDVVIKIDDFKFKNLDDRELTIDSADLDQKSIPINSYLMRRSVYNPDSNPSITLLKNKILTYSVKPIAYSDMFYVRPFHQTEIVWKNNVFLEMSEELIRFYRSIGINININSLNQQSRDKMVILFNYKKPISPDVLDKSRYMSFLEYKNMPEHLGSKSKSEFYFYKLERVSNKSISNIVDLDQTIKSISSYKKTTLILKRPDNKTIKYTFDLI